MIQITPQTRIIVAIEPIDFRWGIDRLKCLVEVQLKEDSFSGCIFVFRSRQGKAIKLLGYDGLGFWLCQHRLSQGKFRFWPSFQGEPGRAVQAEEFRVLLRGDFGKGLEWKKLPVPA